MSTSTPTTTQTPLAAAATATSIHPTLLQLDQSLNGNNIPNSPSPSSSFDPKADDVDVDPGIGNATSRSVPYDRVLVRVDERGPPNHYQHAQDSDPDSSFESSSGRDDMEEEAADEPKTRTSNQQQPQRRIKLNRIDSVSPYLLFPTFVMRGWFVDVLRSSFGFSLISLPVPRLRLLRKLNLNRKPTLKLSFDFDKMFILNLTRSRTKNRTKNRKPRSVPFSPTRCYFWNSGR